MYIRRCMLVAFYAGLWLPVVIVNAFATRSHARNPHGVVAVGCDSSFVSLAATTTESTVDILKELDQCQSATQAQHVMQRYIQQQESVATAPSSKLLYDSIKIPAGASTKGLCDGDLAIQTRLVNKKYAIMDLIDLSGDRDADRASLAVMTVFLSSSIAAVAANQNLPGPEIVRFGVVWALTFAPLALVAYGLRDADSLQTLLVQVQRQLLPRYRKRMLQHEAGHFLMAHLLGFPIAGYQANAVKNAVSFFPLADVDKGPAMARQLGFDSPKNRIEEISIVNQEERPYFSEKGRGSTVLREQSVFRETRKTNYTAFTKLKPESDPSTAWPYRGFDEATLDKLSVVSVAGVSAEILAFGNAEGGIADFSQLRGLFSASEDELSDRDVENRIRFALGYSMTQLRRHLGALDALADAMERDASVAECVFAIESCQDVCGPIGYERQRRNKFDDDGVFEKLILGRDINSDVWEDRYVEGRGGGSRKETFRLGGDDPLYLAIGVAMTFLLWACSGGLSLH